MEKTKCTLATQISRDPKDINDPKNAPYLYTGPNGEKFIDWANPGHKLERWAGRINVLANGSLAEIMDVYTKEYYNRLIRKFNIGPDASDKKEADDDKNVTPFPERKATVDADEALLAMRAMRKEIEKLMWRNRLLAMHAAKTGCPENAKPGCPMAADPPKERDHTSCAGCWQKYAEAVVTSQPPCRKIVPGTENA